MTADHDQTFENVLVEVAANVAWVTLNRPMKRNAISPALSFEMLRVIRLLNENPEVRVIVLTGAGQSFCAGMDLNFLGQLADKPAELAKFSADARGWMWEGITRSPKPIIAMVNGYCFGGGFVPLIASDIAVAGSEALFGLSEINWGHFLGGAVSKLVVDTLGRRKATYLAFTGETIGAEQACELGLVTLAVPHEELKERVSQIAQTLVGKSGIALQATKEALRVTPSMTVDQCYEYAAAKNDQLRIRDKAGIRNRAREEFIEGKTYRPGTGSVRL
ncbi:p-hydroxycinnamoyl CoA hydratase/lyase [Bradyrhizobium brasilense]|uniref:p-hydroxycinnamoyl CoA hydratase/lyase n=1 Tax=Bradyrhizobium brasilense TaxID=1419277 RepID=UPI00322203C1|nr:p-hydroxycinnamoyl CoA hydratase/lyase [Bradyrhizobium brasilense]